MSSSFENGYDWTDEMQPQNLSRYPSDPTSTEDLDYIHLFPSSFPENPDEGLFKRSYFNSSQYQQKPVNLASTGDYRQIDMIYPELTNFDVIHHPTTLSIGSANNDNYGNANIFNPIFTHNQPETYLEDRLLVGLDAAELESNETQSSRNFVNTLEAQFYLPHPSTQPYSSGLIPTKSDHVNEPEISSPTTAAVLDLSPTVPAIGKSPSPESFSPYLFLNGEAGKARPNGTYLTLSDGNPFKNCTSSHSVHSLKFDSSNLLSDLVSPSEESLPNPTLTHFNLNQHKKLLTKTNEDVVVPLSPLRDVLLEERSLGHRTFADHVIYKDNTFSYLGPELAPSSQCTLPRLPKVEVGEDDTQIGKVNAMMQELTPLHLIHQKPGNHEFPSVFNPKESGKEAACGDTMEMKKPGKKSERLRKVIAFVRVEEDGSPEKKAQPKAPLPPKRKKKKKKKPVATCGTCSAQFSEWYRLKIHSYSHTGERPFCCEECGSRFTTSSSLSVHRLKHTGEKPHHCTICDKSFRLASTLKSHLLTHSGQKPFRCDQCPSNFTQRSALKRHERIHRNVREFKCELCGNSFRDKSYFKKHIHSHEIKAKHSCSICGEGFYSNKRLQIHAMKHNEGPNPYKCNKCTAEFVSQKAWRQHKRRIHDRKEELRCEDCDATFKRRESFKAHKKVHCGENLVKCEVCQANFNNIGTLRKHIKKHLNSSFASDTKNKLSVRQTRKIDTPVPHSSNDISFPCCKCHRTFATRQRLRSHRCYTKFDDAALETKGLQLSSNEPVPLTSSPNASGKDERFLIKAHTKETEDSNAMNKYSQGIECRQTFTEIHKKHQNFNLQSQSISPLHPSKESNAATILSAVLQVGESDVYRSERSIT